LAVSRLAADDGAAADRGAKGQSQAGAAADAADGHRRLGAETAHDQTRAGAQDLSLSLAQPGDRAAEPWPNHVWAADITYVPIGRGFLYLVAIIDWASRAVLAWRLSNTMDVGFCRAALEEALARFGKPEIFNTDQGSQFTSGDFTGMLATAGIRISMDGRGRWIDNVFIERLWRSLKYEDIYLKGYADGRDAKAGIGEWLAFYRMAGLLQRAAAAPGTGEPDADGGLARRRRARGRGCGYDAALGQPGRVAHIPTAAATANPCSLTISGGRSGGASN
jgi:transposase InsO family protein